MDIQRNYCESAVKLGLTTMLYAGERGLLSWRNKDPNFGKMLGAQLVLVPLAIFGVVELVMRIALMLILALPCALSNKTKAFWNSHFLQPIGHLSKLIPKLFVNTVYNVTSICSEDKRLETADSLGVNGDLMSNSISLALHSHIFRNEHDLLTLIPAEFRG
ncbi:MAG: hypothetical protein MRY21_08090 [Simkaniaceae bacterium]|nr:hypothetical protein [Simkaniaceae bacterium]